MMTRIEVEKTYWVGMSFEQKESLKSAILAALGNEDSDSMPVGMSDDERMALNDFRLALLNV